MNFRRNLEETLAQNGIQYTLAIGREALVEQICSPMAQLTALLKERQNSLQKDS